MSYQEKSTIVSSVTGILVMAAYIIYALIRYNSGTIQPDDLKFWASTMLVFIVIGVAATIITQIALPVILSVSIAVTKKIQDESVDEKEIEKSINHEMVEDEMDKLISLKSGRIGFGFAGVGFVTGLILLVLGLSPVWMLNITFLSVMLGSLFEGFTQLYYYRRGVRHA